MKILKPEWVSDDNTPLISCDIHPDGSRFAVGGNSVQGGGKIQIWNMAPVLNVKKADDPKCPKLLCAMFNHMSCVNSVRWTLSGKYLASGGDDRLVMIWAFGGKSKKDDIEEENWKCVHRLQGHDADVIDLAWNRNDKYLASASLDNTVIVWNADDGFKELQKLNGHTNFVKGITWDPVGNYLASQGADGTVRIWNTVNWKEETKISEPFTDTSNGHVMRISWSPDGCYLIAGSAVNNGGPSAQVISRKWTTGFDLVGHRKSVSCVRFAPTCRLTPDGNRSNIGNDSKTPVCALGSRDCSISVWLTSLKRPLVVVHDIFEDSILDLSWDSTGLILMATSWDGAAAFLQFRADELGKQISFGDMNKMLEEHYGSTAQDLRDIIIENPALIHMGQNGIQKPVDEIKRGPDKQIVAKRKDGKKRITPAFLTGISASTPKPFGEPNSPMKKKPTDSPKSSSSTIKPDDAPSETKPPPILEVPKEKIHLEKSVPEKPKVTEKPSEEIEMPKPKEKVKDKSKKEKIEVNLDFNKPSREGDQPEERTRRKRKRKEEREEVVLPIHKHNDNEEAKKNSAEEKNENNAEQIVLHVMKPKLEAIVTQPSKISGKINSFGLKIVLEDFKSIISCEKQNWNSIIDGLVVAVEIHQKKVIVCTCEGEILYISIDSGKRSELTEFVGKVHQFQVKDNKLLIVTTDGRIELRNLVTGFTDTTSDLRLIQNPRDVWISSRTGEVSVSTHDGVVLGWNSTRSRWYITHKSSSYIYSRALFGDTEMIEHLDEVHRQPAYATGKHLGEMVAAGFEEELNQAIATENPQTYRRTLMQYGRHLSLHNMRSRLKELCDLLLGPVHNSESDWEAEMLGLSKRKLLRDILDSVRSNIVLQRLYSEYDEMLQMANDMESNIMSE